jgi:hypothetical protein
MTTVAQSDTNMKQEQHKLIRAQDSVGALGSDLFGDQINYYNGTTEFVQSDVSINGNSSLPVGIGRRFTMVNRAAENYNGAFLNWDLEIPHVHGIFAKLSSPTYNHWPAGTANSQNALRCSQFAAPPGVTVFDANGSTGFYPEEYWQGTQLYVPGIGDQEMLQNNRAIGPSDGIARPAITKNFWVSSCLPISNPGTGRAGEGFKFLSPDGVAYEFTQLAFRNYDVLVRPGQFDP